jgi:hypothetical protein
MNAIDSYSPEEIRKCILEVVGMMTPEPLYTQNLVTAKGARFKVVIDKIGWHSMGECFLWAVFTKAGTLVGAGRVEHDDEYADETGKPAWVEQAAFILPKYQRMGIYSRVLRILTRKLRADILADTQQTQENQMLWKKLAPSGVFRKNPDNITYGWDPSKRPRVLHIWVGTRGTCQCGAYTGPDPRLYWSKTAALPGGAKICKRCAAMKQNPRHQADDDADLIFPGPKRTHGIQSVGVRVRVFPEGPHKGVLVVPTTAQLAHLFPKALHTPHPKVFDKLLEMAQGTLVKKLARQGQQYTDQGLPMQIPLRDAFNIWHPHLSKPKRNPGRSYLDRAIKEFGTTDDPGTGFFILPDGSFLDGSAGSGYGRADDHRILAGLYPKAHEAEQKHGSRYALLVKIMQRANLIRWIPEAWAADVVTQPTGYQISTLVDLAQVQPLTVEVFRQTREFEAYDAERIEGWIDRKL